MVKTFKRIIALGITLILLAALASAMALSGSGCSSFLGDPSLAALRTAAVNGAVNVSGVKTQADQELRNHADAIAAKTGLPPAAVEQAVDALAIPDWEVCDLPAGAQPLGTHSIHQGGLNATVTTYDVSDVVTVQAYGQNMTFQVPPTAEPYLTLLSALG